VPVFFKTGRVAVQPLPGLTRIVPQPVAITGTGNTLLIFLQSRCGKPQFETSFVCLLDEVRATRDEPHLIEHRLEKVVLVFQLEDPRVAVGLYSSSFAPRPHPLCL
jgi:hypothetical protein